MQQAGLADLPDIGPQARRRLALPFAGLAARLEAERERWFLWLPVAIGAGIAAYFAAPVEPGWAQAVLPLAIVLAVWHAVARGTLGLLACAALAAVAFGFALAKVRTETQRAPVLETQLQAAQVRGFVELVEPRPGQAQRLTVRVLEIASLSPDARPLRVRVRMQRTTAGLKPGDAVRLTATLSPPPIPALPGDYDFARSAWFAGLGAVGFSRGAAEILHDAPRAPAHLAFAAAIERLRQDIGQRITAALPGEQGAIASALVTGERGAISEATNQAFRDAGLYHMLSISGLHMSIVAGAAFLLVRVLLAAVPAVALRRPIKKWAAVAAMLAAFCYLLISGMAFATLRSYVMISIMFVAILLDRPAIALRNVAVAALVILIAWPESLLDAGFQMSFAAVAALVSAYEWTRARRQGNEAREARLGRGVGLSLAFLAGIVLTTLIASAAVAPFGVYHFHNVQAYAVLANLIAIPVCNFLVMPAALAAMLLMPLGLESAPLWGMGQGIGILVWCAHGIASLPGAAGRVAAIPTASFALLVGGGLWLLLWRTHWRLLGIGAMLLGLLLAPVMPRPDLLVGRNAELIAARVADRRLSALPARGAAYDLARWLEFDGDNRTAALAGRGEGWTCDALGCTTRVKGRRIAVAHTPAALADDCRVAEVVILQFAPAPPCPSAGLVIDRTVLAAAGAVAVYIADDAAGKQIGDAAGRGGRVAGSQRQAEPGPEAGAKAEEPARSAAGGRVQPERGLRVETVRSRRGDRPWSRHRPRLDARERASARRAAPSRYRLAP